MIYSILILYTAFLVVLFFYALHPYLLLYYYLRIKKQRKIRRGKILKKFPHVTIQLPIYNEKFVIHRLLRAITALDYPKNLLEIQVLDDSSDVTTDIVHDLVKRYQKKGFDIHHIQRGSRDGYKAGALQYGLERAKGQYLAIFDADFVPPTDFLKKLLPEFQERKIGGVQARWGHLNHDYSFLTRSQAIGLDNHFVMEQGVRSQLNCFINFNGTCGLWSKEAIVDAGGWDGDTLAEDLDLSYRVQLKGWQIKYRGDVVVKGELPARTYGFRVQQNRWAKGTIQVARKLLLKIIASPLTLLTKYEAFIHLTCHINFIAMLGLALFSLPIVIFKVEGLVSGVYYIAISFFTIGVFGYPILYILSQKETYSDYWRRIPYVFGVIAYSMGLSVSNSISIVEGWFHQKHVFTRTPKTGGMIRTYRPEKISIVPFIEIAFGLYMMVSLVYVVATLQLILIPFLLLYAYGFLSMGLSTLRDEFGAMRPPEVVCSRENS